MRAAVLRAFNEPLEVTEVAEPEPREDEVLVRVRALGLCATDLKVNSGALDTVPLPLVPGHEIAGELVEDVDDLRAGQRVACYIYLPCGHCRLCRLGETSLCRHLVRLGIERNGGLGEYVAVPRKNLIPFSENLTFETAAVSMDAVLTPWRALRARADVQPGEKVVIVGAGGLGLNGLQIARAVGAEVAVVDPSGGARERALELGASLVVGPDEADQVREWSDGGVDVGFDASGALSGFRTALASLRPGGRLACVGYQVGLDFPFDSSRLVLEEITLLGARAGQKAEAEEALRAVEGGAIHPQIMDRLPLEQINEGLNRLKAGQIVGRLVIEMGR